MYFVFSSGEDGWLLFTFLQKKSEAGGSYNKAEEGQCCEAALRSLAQAAPWLEYLERSEEQVGQTPHHH